jgi:hypothetical protein
MAKAGKPNILVIFGDDIGWFNPSIYNRGMMGYRTPNIDRIGNEGAVFTDWYGQQSCTAGRAAFITGQCPNYRIPRTYNLRSDPFERADESAMPFNTNQLYFLVPAQAVVSRWLSTFKEFPPRQKSASFNVDDVVDKIMDAAAKGPGR